MNFDCANKIFQIFGCKTVSGTFSVAFVGSSILIDDAIRWAIGKFDNSVDEMWINYFCNDQAPEPFLPFKYKGKTLLKITIKKDTNGEIKFYDHFGKEIL